MLIKNLPYLAVTLGVGLMFGSLLGCERKERMLDVETPGADIEIDRNIDTGEVEVDVNDK